MTQDSKYGRLDEYCRGKRVFPVSPNTFYACLNAIAISLQGQKIEENARHLLASMAGLKKQFESFADVYEKLGTHLRHAQQCYEEADSRLTARGILSSRCRKERSRRRAQGLGTQRQLKSSAFSEAYRQSFRLGRFRGVARALFGPRPEACEGPPQSCRR